MLVLAEKEGWCCSCALIEWGLFLRASWKSCSKVTGLILLLLVGLILLFFYVLWMSVCTGRLIRLGIS